MIVTSVKKTNVQTSNHLGNASLFSNNTTNAVVRPNIDHNVEVIFGAIFAVVNLDSKVAKINWIKYIQIVNPYKILVAKNSVSIFLNFMLIFCFS